jgi:hypothetical protein
MGFGNGAFQAARISIDGVTIIENITNGKIQTTSASTAFGAVITAPQTDVAWGFAGYLLENNSAFNVATILNWTGANDAASLSDAVSLTGSSSAVDGTASGHANTVASMTLNLSTSNADDIIIVYVSGQAKGSPFSSGTISITDTAGLLWTQRSITLFDTSEDQFGNFYNTFVAEFYAIAPAPLANDTLTITGTGPIHDFRFNLCGSIRPDKCQYYCAF